MAKQRSRCLALCVVPGIVGLWDASFFAGYAQSITPSGDTETQIESILLEQNGIRYDIEGETLSSDGSNLFHSLEQLGLSANEIANFIANPEVQNILTRIVGGEASLINGLIQVSGSDANLFLMNPAGIIFGSEASLNVPADFTATTATGIGFEAGWFSAIGDNNYEQLVGSPNRFAFTALETGSIINSGDLASGNALSLLGGIVINNGTLSAPNEIAVVAVSDEKLIRLSQPGNLMSLEIEILDTTSLPNAWTIPIAALPELLTGGEISNATQLEFNDQGNLVLTGSGLTSPVNSGSVIVSGVVDAANLDAGETGGTVQLFGTDIRLLNAEVDVSGLADGGAVFIGGELALPERVPFASSIVVDETSSIRADSITDGDGGQIDVAADSAISTPISNISFDGQASANGGLLGGNGGTIQTNQLVSIVAGQLDVAAPSGEVGEIVGFSSDSNIPFDPDPPAPSAPDPGYFAGSDDLGDPDPAVASDDAGTPDLGNPTPSQISEARQLSRAVEVEPISPLEALPTLSTPNDGSFYGLYSVSFSSYEYLYSQRLQGSLVLFRNDLNDSTSSEELDIFQGTQAFELYQQGVEKLKTLDLEGAYRYLSQSLTDARESRDEILQLYILSDLGFLSQVQGNYFEAIGYHQDLLKLSQDNNQLSTELDALWNLCHSYFSLGENENATEFCQQTVRLSDQANLPHRAALASGLLLEIDIRNNGDYGQIIDAYEQRITLAQENNDLKTESLLIGQLGYAYSLVQNYTGSLALLQDALAIAEQIEDADLAALHLNHLGTVYYTLGKYQDAEESYQRAIAIDQDRENIIGLVSSMTNLGNTYFSRGNYSDAIAQYEQALTFSQNFDLFSLESIVLGNLGSIFGSLGNYEQAIELHEQQLAIARQIGDSTAITSALGNLGNTYGSLEGYQQSIQLYQEQLQQARTLENSELESIALNNLGQVYRKSLQYSQAIEFYQSALLIAKEINNRHGEAVISLGLGQVYHDSGQFTEALKYYQQALSIQRELDNSAAERDILSQVGRLLDEQGYIELSIVFYKQAVNISEVLRQDVQSLPQTVQQGYTDEVLSDTYRALADLLLRQDRVLEAQRVLDLLKVQELEDYLGQVRGNEQTIPGIDYYQPEQRILELYDQAITLGQEIERLRSVPLGDRTSEQETRLRELVELEQEIVVSFFEFVDSPEIVNLVNQLTRTARRQNLDLEELNALRDNLQSLNQNAVLFYPLILEERLELILVTPYSPPIRRTVSVSRETLNQTILEFRRELVNPTEGLFPASQKLYDWLIRPLEDDLVAANAETIVYAPDGQLRYVPLAAFNDGDRWLAENFRVNHITAASLTDFDTQPSRSLSVLAAAYSDSESNYSFAVGQRNFNFTGLPYAGLEVELIASEIADTTSLFDSNFTREQTLPQMNDHNIVHLATHAEFVTGNPEDSFILFGDGDRVTLRDIATWSLPNVDLVVLSACKTAVGDELGNGEEILGFGYQLQRTGARAAIASLWSVSDGGTQMLMNSFYDALDNSTLSKAEALQQAQIAMITGEASEISLETSELSQFVNAYRHPYYWSSFILIGNGL